MTETYTPPPVSMRQVLKSWILAEDAGGGPPGVSLESLAAVEEELERPLPEEVRELYRTFNGGDFAFSNLSIEGLYSLTTQSDQLREWEWPIPDELVIFGGNGSDDMYGIWLPASNIPHAPVVVSVGEAMDSYAVVGDTLAGFLAARSAYYLLSDFVDSFDPVPALDALGVPAELRIGFTWDDAFSFNLLNWANPNLPDKTPDSYQRGLSVAQINEHSQALARLQS